MVKCQFLFKVGGGYKSFGDWGGSLVVAAFIARIKKRRFAQDDLDVRKELISEEQDFL